MYGAQHCCIQVNHISVSRPGNRYKHSDLAQKHLLPQNLNRNKTAEVFGHSLKFRLNSDWLDERGGDMIVNISKSRPI